MVNTTYDLVVVGGGLAGLTTAWKVQQAGYSVLVLEGRDRVGGRTLTRTETYKGKDTYFDFGAHFIGNDGYQKDIWDLVHDDLGLETFPQYEGPEDGSGRHYYNQAANLLCTWNGKNGKPDTEAYIGPILPPSVPEFVAYAKLEALLLDVYYAGFDNFVNRPMDDMSVADWVRDQKLQSDEEKNLMGLTDMLCRVGFSATAEEISFLWFLFYLDSSGGMGAFSNVRYPSQGAQGYRLKKGAQSISDALAERIRAVDQDAVLLNRKVTGMSFGATNFATCENGERYQFRTALVAMAPSLANTIEMSPPLPKERTDAAELMKMGQTVMVCVRFTKPFWRTDTTRYPTGRINGFPGRPVSRNGLSGNAMVVGGPVVWTMDNCSFEGDPAMFAFVVGQEALQWGSLPLEKRKSIIYRVLGTLYGDDAVMAHLKDYNEKIWPEDPFSHGCPAGHFGKGDFIGCYKWIMTDKMPPFQDNHLFFASTESASLSNGYMSGAVWAGKKTAEKVVKALQAGRSGLSTSQE